MNRTTSFAVMVVCLALAIFVGAYGETLAPSVAPAAKLPAAPFVEGRMNGLQVSRRGDYSYTPSVAIKAAATRHDSGLWPFRRRWYEFAPPGASPKAVVVLLHGAGRDELSMLEMWRDTAVRHELLLVAPNGRGGAWPGGDADRAFISGLAREAATARGLPAEGVFLFGHSAGARLAQEILNQAEPGR
jgi:pimeloyl-ACP methyl ester carboxylesterase